VRSCQTGRLVGSWLKQADEQKMPLGTYVLTDAYSPRILSQDGCDLVPIWAVASKYRRAHRV